MSQPSSDLEGFGGEMFATAESTYGEAEAVAPEPQVVYRKQGFSIYTVMLILSFVFLTAASILLFMDVNKF